MINSHFNYNDQLDKVMFRHYTIPKKNGSVRHVYEFDNNSTPHLYGEYVNYANKLRYFLGRQISDDIKTRTAYNKNVSIPDIIKHLSAGKIFVQLDIVDFFNVVQLAEFDNLIPQNYYYDPINKVGIKQGTNISGDITNIALYEFDIEMVEKYPSYCRYADDIIIGLQTKEEANEAMEFVANKLTSLGLTINKRKTQITDLTDYSERYVKYLGYTIKRDKYQHDKLRVTISRKKRNFWWAKQQKAHANRKLEGGFVCT